MTTGKAKQEKATGKPGAGGPAGFAGGVIYDLFIASLVLFVALELLDSVWARSVSCFFNIQYLLLAVLLTGAIALLAGVPAPVDETRRGRWEADELVARFSVYAIGVMGMILAMYAAEATRYVQYLVAVTVGASIILVSFSLLVDRELALSHRLSAGPPS